MLNTFLRHTVATIHYRFRKSVAPSNPEFGTFSLGHGSRNPSQIVNHMHEVLRSSCEFITSAKIHSHSSEQLAFDLEVARFMTELSDVDQALALNALSLDSTRKLLQGPFADILTHIGQISMLQRLHGNPIEGEDFSAAVIKTGLA